MKLTEMNTLPNDGFAVTACLAAALGDKILLGGGSGFKTPILAGGKKLASATIRLLSPHGQGWTVHDTAELSLGGKKYGFCNGVNASVGSEAWFLGGMKSLDDGGLTVSRDALRVWVENGKIKHEIIADAVPFGGELSGCQLADGSVLALAGSDLYRVAFRGGRPHAEKIDTGPVDLNGSLPLADGNDAWFAGGYRPFAAGDEASNRFDETRLVHYGGGKFAVKRLRNLDADPLVFLGASGVSENGRALIVGGVDKEYFTYAIQNLSTLKDAALEAFRQVYFGGSPETFKFNRRLVALDFKTGKTEVLGSFKEGYAGGPNVVALNGAHYVLAGEIKAGVRLHVPVAFTL